jgi:hypothetical protein
MQKLVGFAIALLGLVLFWAGAQTADKEKTPPGKEIFLQYKCNSCHSVESQKIVVKKGKDEEEDEDEDKVEPPDLSGVGLEHDAKWMNDYLLKKEKLHDKAHRKKFRGKAPELKDLTTWLSTLKTEPKGAKKGDAKASEKKSEKAATK